MAAAAATPIGNPNPNNAANNVDAYVAAGVVQNFAAPPHAGPVVPANLPVNDANIRKADQDEVSFPFGTIPLCICNTPPNFLYLSPQM